MRPLTLVRAVQWMALAVTGWSLNLRWGDEAAAGHGPPSQWERHVVGAALLLFLAALASSFTGRKGARPGKVSTIVAFASALGAVGLAFSLRSNALDHHMPHLLAGSGWFWMSAGAALSLSAGISMAVLAFIADPGASKPRASRSKANTGRGAASRKKR